MCGNMSVKNLKMNTEYNYFNYFYYSGCFLQKHLFHIQKDRTKNESSPFKIAHHFYQIFSIHPFFQIYENPIPLFTKKEGAHYVASILY